MNSEKIRLSELLESAKLCSKITNFYAKLHSSTQPENENCDELGSPGMVSFFNENET